MDNRKVRVMANSNLSELDHIYTSSSLDDILNNLRHQLVAMRDIDTRVDTLSERVTAYEDKEKVSETDMEAFINNERFEVVVSRKVDAAVDHAKEQYSQERMDNDFMIEWMEANLNDRVESCLDNMMCEKTQRTIEEYNLVNCDQVGEQVSEYISYNCDFIDSDRAAELAEEFVSEQLSHERIAEEIGTVLECSEFVEELVVKVVSKLIANAVISDVNVLSGVKRFIPALKDVKYEELGGCTNGQNS